MSINIARMINSTWAVQDATTARRDATDALTEVKELHERMERMVLLNTAMWTLIREKLGITDSELADRVQELDLRDGQLDGKIGPESVACPKCRRRFAPKHRRCLYCGTQRT